MGRKKDSKEVEFLRGLITDEMPEPLCRLATLTDREWRAAKKDPSNFMKEAGLKVPAGIKIKLESGGPKGAAQREKICGWFCYQPFQSYIYCVKICFADPDTVVSWL